MSTQINNSIITGISSLEAGETVQTIELGAALSSVPQSIVATIVNTSADTVKLAISASVVAKSVNGFTVQLTGAPNTANYQLSWSIYLETGAVPIAPFQTGSQTLTSGQIAQTITVTPVFGILPEYLVATVSNVSSDATKFSIYATIISIAIDQFVVVLSGAPNSANYTLSWEAYAQSEETVTGTITLIKATLQEGFFPGSCPQHVWPLRVQAVSTIPGLMNAIFVYHAAMDNDPYQGDSFSCVASVQQMRELPVNAATSLEGRVIPYYRKDIAQYDCRSASQAETLWAAIQDNVQALADNWKAATLITPRDTEIITIT